MCVQLSADGKREPDPYVLLQLGNSRHQTTAKDSATNPIWQEQFEFLAGDPSLQELRVSVGSSLLLGRLVRAAGM